MEWGEEEGARVCYRKEQEETRLTEEKGETIEEWEKEGKREESKMCVRICESDKEGEEAKGARNLERG